MVEAIGDRRRDRRICRRARASRRRRRHEPGQHAAGRDGAGAGRASIVPPVRIARGGRAATTTCCASCSRTCARRTSGAATCGAQRAACAAGRDGWLALLRARGRGAAATPPCDALLDYTERRVRARASPQLDGVRGRAARRARGRWRDRRRRPGASSTSRVADGTLHLDFTGTSPQVRGQRELPARRRRARRRCSCCARCSTTTCPTNDGIARALDLVDSRRAARSNARVAGGGRRGQRGDVAAHHRHDLRRARPTPASTVPAQGQGTMNNITFGGARLDVLRDARRRAGRERARAGAERGARRHEQHAQHADRVARAAPTRCASTSTRCGAGRAARAGIAAATASCAAIACWSGARSTLLTERRRHAPQGAAGGGAGHAGQQPAERAADSGEVPLELEPGDVVTVMTPGGGGWGTAA